MIKMYDGDYADYKKEVSGFNEGQAQIYRLTFLWDSANKHSKMGNFTDWFNTLEIIWRELYADYIHIRENGNHIRRDYEMLFSKLDSLIIKYSKTKNRSVLYKLLKHKDMRLRCLQDEVGKGTKRYDNTESIL